MTEQGFFEALDGMGKPFVVRQIGRRVVIRTPKGVCPVSHVGNVVTGGKYSSGQFDTAAKAIELPFHIAFAIADAADGEEEWFTPQVAEVRRKLMAYVQEAQ